MTGGLRPPHPPAISGVPNLGTKRESNLASNLGSKVRSNLGTNLGTNLGSKQDSNLGCLLVRVPASEGKTITYPAGYGKRIKRKYPDTPASIVALTAPLDEMVEIVRAFRR